MNDLNEQHLVDIIERRLLTPLFQPIVALGQKNIYAYEALIRGPSDSPLHSPINLFSMAERCGYSVALESACRLVNIQRFAALQTPYKLFLNVSPKVLLDPAFKKGETLTFLEQSGVPASNIVIEITEQQPTDDYHLMRDAVSHYRNMGFKIALDDLGAGYSGLRLWTELLPDYVKIDRHFIQDIDKDKVKLNFVRSLQSMADATHCHIVAEGVETEDEYRTIEQLGISYSQGYYFARPSVSPLTELPEQLFSRPVARSAGAFNATLSIQRILHEMPAVSPRLCNEDILRLFQQDSELTVVPLVEAGKACGIIYRDQFLTRLFASRYGLDLYGRRPVGAFVELAPLQFEQTVAIEEASKHLTNAPRSEAAFIITENGFYRGVGTVMDLLQLITEQQLNNAKHANPLTYLPGITPINNLINSFIADNKRFALGYFDLDNFKPFNDCYGYDKGDQAIKLLAGILTEQTSHGCGYVGHIGGDDFIVIFTGQDWEKICLAILSDFEAKVKALYSKEDIMAGGILGYDRQGNPTRYPFLSVSAGMVAADAIIHCHSHIEVADLATESKQQAKQIVGNSFFINRREMDKRKTMAGSHRRSRAIHHPTVS